MHSTNHRELQVRGAVTMGMVHTGTGGDCSLVIALGYFFYFLFNAHPVCIWSFAFFYVFHVFYVSFALFLCGKV
jgi:hypothetical protein